MTLTPAAEVVARLLAVIGGDAPMSDAARLLAPDVICHMDQYTARGLDVWVDWLDFIRSRCPEGLFVDVEQYVTDPEGIVTAFGCLRRGAKATTRPCHGEARYRVEKNRVVEIWTSRGNYEIIFGAKVRHSLSWLLVLVELAVWRRLPFRSPRGSYPRRGPVTEPETNRAIVAKLMTILSGDTPIEAGVELLSPQVVMHVDGWGFEGINVWANWIQYLRTRGRLAEPTLIVDRLEVNADATITAHGRWAGTRDGREMTSRPCRARYRVVDGRIVEIWSTRRNYTFFCGRHVEYRLGLAVEFLRVRQWKKSTAQLDLTSQVRAGHALYGLPALVAQAD